MLNPLAAAPGTSLGALAEGAIPAASGGSSPPSGYATANGAFLLYPKYASFQLAGGTTAVTANDQPIGRLTDHLGNGHHFEGSGSTRPLRKTVSGVIVAQTDATSLLADIGTAVSSPDTDHLTLYAVLNHTLGKQAFITGGASPAPGTSGTFLYSDDKAYAGTAVGGGDASALHGILASGPVAVRFRRAASTDGLDGNKWKFAASGAGGSEIYLSGARTGDFLISRLFSRTGYGGGASQASEAGEGIAYVHVFLGDTVGADDATEIAYIASEFGLTIPDAVAWVP